MSIRFMQMDMLILNRERTETLVSRAETPPWPETLSQMPEIPVQTRHFLQLIMGLQACSWLAIGCLLISFMIL